MKKILGKVRQNLFGFILGTIIFGSIGVYAATVLASEIKYTNNGQENVQGAIDDLYDKSKNNCPEGKACISKTDAKGKFPICKRATKLHSDENYTYGSLGTNGTLSSGDAFDCDVNLDGTYDSEKERFYYLSEYYNTTSNEYESDTAVLVYYNNTNKGIADSTLSGNIEYSSNGNNTSGPITAITNLPTTSQWINVSLKNTNRAILDEQGNIVVNNFNYSGYAARLLEYNEVVKACGSVLGSGKAKGCNYILLENLKLSSTTDGLTYGYWYETAKSGNTISAYAMNSAWGGGGVGTASCSGEDRGTRPVIEVPISDIEY